MSPRVSTRQTYVAGLLALGVGGVAAGRAGDAPGVLLLGAALVLGTTAWAVTSARPPLAVLLGLACMAAGASDDAPGAVLLGLLLVVGTLGWCFRRTGRTAA